MLKRKEFIVGAAVGLTFAAAATAGGVLDWPSARADNPSSARPLTPSAGRPGLAFAPPQGAPLSFADIFDQVSPAVVQIDVRTRVTAPRTMTIPGTPFRFEVPPGMTPPGQQGEEGGEEEDGIEGLGSGSGFFISADGFIVTNNHVVENAEEITVRLSDERELTARLVGRDEETDLAVLKVEGGPFPFVSFEESAAPRVGDWVIAVGNPFGLGGTATAGIVSAQGRDIGGPASPFNDFIQIDAAINRGNSGGPTFDIYGRVIGVNSAIFSPTGGSVGIGFAIPADVAKQITDRLMRGETIERGYLGVTITDFSSDMAESMGLEADFEGAYISDVTPDGPAATAGLRAGDIVTSLNGEAIESSTELTRLVGRASAGDTLRLEIQRDGRMQSLTVRSGTRPSQAELRGGTDQEGPSLEQGPSAQAEGQEVVGLNVAPMSPALRNRFSIPESIDGLVITDVASNANRLRGFEAGFVILRAGGGTARTVADFEAAVAQARQAERDSVFLLVWTPVGNRPVVLELPDAEASE